MDHFPMMARFNAWANERIYTTVAQVPEETYRRDGKAFFGSIHGTLNHLLVVDRLWTRRIQGKDPGIPSLDHILCEDFDALRATRREEDRRYIELVDGLDAEALLRPIRYRRMIGEGMEEVRTGHILATLANHQTHHRGQVHVLLTQAGVVPPPLDIVFFLEEVGEAGPPGTLLPE